MPPKQPDKSALCAAFGRKVRNARLSMGLTQVELADKISIKRPQLANLETGKTWVGIEAFYGLVTSLNLRIDTRVFDKKGKTT